MIKKYIFLSSLLSITLLANINQTKLNYKQNENIDISNYLNINNVSKIEISNELYKYLSFENEYNKENILNCKIINNKFLNCDSDKNFDIVIDIEEKGTIVSKNFKLLNNNEKPLQKDLLYDDLINRNADINIENQKINKELAVSKEENNLLRNRVNLNSDFNNQIVTLEQHNSELKKENELLKKRNEYLLNELNKNKNEVEIIDENGPKLSSVSPLRKNIGILGNKNIINTKNKRNTKQTKNIKNENTKIDEEKLKNILNNNFN